MNCIDCKFYVNNGDRFGVCKRYPKHENTYVTDWCGEFVAKVVEQKLEPKVEPVETKKRGKKNGNQTES